MGILEQNVLSGKKSFWPHAVMPIDVAIVQNVSLLFLKRTRSLTFFIPISHVRYIYGYALAEATHPLIWDWVFQRHHLKLRTKGIYNFNTILN